MSICINCGHPPSECYCGQSTTPPTPTPEPCPFCGGKPEIRLSPGIRTVEIKCPKCVIKYKQKYLRITEGELLERMIANWNTRIPSAREIRLEDALKAIARGLFSTRNAQLIAEQALATKEKP